MKTTGVEYEQFIKKIILGIQNTKRVITDLQGGKRNSIQGISGVKHQIDVSFIDSSFQLPTLVLIECKQHTTPINLGLVKIVHSTEEDIYDNRKNFTQILSILVYTSKVQKGAQEYADYYKIQTVKLPLGPNFIFQYENIISVGLIVTAGRNKIVATPKIIKRCEKCGHQYEVIDNNYVCPYCS